MTDKTLFVRGHVRSILLIIAFFLFCSSALAEELSYTITKEKLLWWDREVISEGTLTYSYSDIITENRSGFVSKYIHVAEKFNIGASIYRESEITGFGLWINKNGKGFSWEWFILEQDNVFRKLQESGRLLVAFRKNDGLNEIESVEFIEDVSMRLDNLNFIPFWFKKTHRMLIKKGSKLVFLPPNKAN